VPSKNLSKGIWEHRNIAGSAPLQRDLLLGEIPQNTNRNKKRAFYVFQNVGLLWRKNSMQ
jgi:hypothetical protein